MRRIALLTAGGDGGAGRSGPSRHAGDLRRAPDDGRGADPQRDAPPDRCPGGAARRASPSATVRRVTMRLSSAYSEGTGTIVVEQSRFPDGGGVSTFYGAIRVSDSFFDGGGVGGGPSSGISVTRGNLFTGSGRGVEGTCSTRSGRRSASCWRTTPSPATVTRSTCRTRSCRARPGTAWRATARSGTPVGESTHRAEDLGGNVAFGDGNEPQCVGVAC